MRVMAATLAILTSSVALAQQPAGHLTLYKTASSAACGGDETVWVDPKTHSYYLRGNRLYGKTSPGGYNCRKQADDAGYHAVAAR
jgi:hypothetical protein